jgi:hypothetical protein
VGILGESEGAESKLACKLNFAASLVMFAKSPMTICTAPALYGFGSASFGSRRHVAHIFPRQLSFVVAREWISVAGQTISKPL